MKDREDYIKTINPDFNSHIEKGTIEMNNEYYNLLEEKIARLINQNQELKSQLKVPENCNLKTLEDYKSYYEDTTREQILEDSYIDYCAYVNLAHKYSKLKKQLEEYKKELESADNLTQICIFKGKEENKISYRKCLNILDKKETQQKEFIKWLEDEIHTIETTYSQINGNYGLMNEKLEALKEVLEKYKKIIGE